MRNVRRYCGFVSLVAVLAVAGWGAAGAASTPIGSTTDPAGWKRCGSTARNFSIAYPGNWHVASYNRLHVLGQGDAYRRRFFQRVVCLNYDPRPFTVYDGSEYPTTAVVVNRWAAGKFPYKLSYWFRPRDTRTILHRATVVGGHPAIRFHVYLKSNTGLYPHSHVYGYLINFGRKGGMLVEAWRYGFKPIPWTQYRARMAIVDRMAPTARITHAS